MLINGIIYFKFTEIWGLIFWKLSRYNFSGYVWMTYIHTIILRYEIELKYKERWRQ